MPLSRVMKNKMRGSKGPVSGTKQASGKPLGSSKQYNHTGKKYSGPNYPKEGGVTMDDGDELKM